MGFITLKDGTVIHASLLNNVNVKPSEYKMSYIGFSEAENRIINQRKEINDLIFTSFRVDNLNDKDIRI